MTFLPSVFQGQILDLDGSKKNIFRNKILRKNFLIKNFSEN